MNERVMVNANDRYLYRPEEAAQLLSIGKTKFYQLMKEGRITTVKVGTARLVSRDALRKFIASLEDES